VSYATGVLHLRTDGPTPVTLGPNSNLDIDDTDQFDDVRFSPVGFTTLIQGRTHQVLVSSVRPGSRANVPAGHRWSGAHGVRGVNPAAMTGGYDRATVRPWSELPSALRQARVGPVEAWAL